MTNSERRICLLERVADPPGEALPDWRIISRVAAALGHGDAFDYSCSEEIFAEYRELTRGRDLDITGVDYALLRETGGVQWPYPQGASAGSERLFEDGHFATADGRARFHIPRDTPPDDAIDDGFPLALLTGRVKDQWHTRTRTGHVPKLNKREPAPYLEMHRDDARALGLRNGQTVRVVWRRGDVELPLRLSAAVRPGTLFAPFHWGALWDERAVANRVTNEASDPRSKQPELKFAAVRVEAV